MSEVKRLPLTDVWEDMHWQQRVMVNGLSITKPMAYCVFNTTHKTPSSISKTLTWRYKKTMALTSVLASHVALWSELPKDKFPMLLPAPGAKGQITINHMTCGFHILGSEVSHKCKHSHSAICKWWSHQIMLGQQITSIMRPTAVTQAVISIRWIKGRIGWLGVCWSQTEE